ncbi:MAG: hypothetical protein R2736_10365 [Solirubrobacterales bacterium]
MPRILVALSVVLALAAVPAASAKRAPRCPPHGAQVVQKTVRAAVFVRASTGAYVGCLRPRGSARRLATPDDIYSSVDAVALAGRFAAYVFSETPACKADCPPDVTGSGRVGVVDLRTGRRAGASALGVQALALTRSGTAAYLVADGLHALSATGDVVLDTGDIPPKSVTASGTTIRWTNAGVPQSRDVP